jgi:integrase
MSSSRAVNAVAGRNLVHGVKRPEIERMNARRRHQARAPLGARTGQAEGLRDRAILAVLLYHELRCEDAAQLDVSDILEYRGIKHLLLYKLLEAFTKEAGIKVDGPF